MPLLNLSPARPNSLRRLFLALAALTIVLSLPGCRKQLSPAELKGASLYRTHCAACHEEPPAGLLKTPPRLDHLFSKSTLPDGVPVSDQAVESVILEGLGTMPAFKGRLHDDELRFIIAYLHSRN